MPPNQIQPPTSDALLHKVVARLDNLHSDIGDMKSTMRELTAAVTRLALIEERQAQATQAIDRAFKSIEKVEAKTEAVESRVDSLERDQPMQRKTSQWVTTAVYSAAALALTFAAKSVGLL